MQNQPKIEEPTYLIRNSARCTQCDGEAESTYGQQVPCRCGALEVDGGQDYIRRYGPAVNSGGYEDTSLYAWTAARDEVDALLRTMSAEELVVVRPDLVLTTAQERARYANDEEGRKERNAARLAAYAPAPYIGGDLERRIKALIAAQAEQPSAPAVVSGNAARDGMVRLTLPISQFTHPTGGMVGSAGALTVTLYASQLAAAMRGD